MHAYMHAYVCMRAARAYTHANKRVHKTYATHKVQLIGAVFICDEKVKSDLRSSCFATIELASRGLDRRSHLIKLM